MAFVYTGETYNQIEVNYTKEALRGIIRTDKDAFTPYYFSFADPDTNYALASTASTVTTYTNVLLRGEVPSLTGNDSATSTDSCVNVLNNSTYDPSKGIKRGEIDTYGESCQPGYVPMQIDLTPFDPPNLSQNQINTYINLLGFNIFNGQIDQGAFLFNNNISVTIQASPFVTQNSSFEDIGEAFKLAAINSGYDDTIYDLNDDNVLTLYLNREMLKTALGGANDDEIVVVINELYLPSFISGFNFGNIGGGNTFLTAYQTPICRWDYTGLYDNFGS